jgi:hypothetical protein
LGTTINELINIQQVKKKLDRKRKEVAEIQ